MAGGEVSAIAEMANLVANDLVKWFKWTKFPLVDQNFKCLKVEKHSTPRRKRKVGGDATQEASQDDGNVLVEDTIGGGKN